MERAFTGQISLDTLERKLSALPIPPQQAWVAVLKR